MNAGSCVIRGGPVQRRRYEGELRANGQILDHPLAIGDAAPVQGPRERESWKIMPYFARFGVLEQGRVLGLYWFAPAVPASFFLA